MIVSWKWLQDYVSVNASPAEVVNRLMMAGLNHEETTAAGDDLAIDLEITSNRPDCLGHLGVAREMGVLFGVPMRLPTISPRESSTTAASLTKVRIDCLELCPRYVARVIRGIKIGRSPDWLIQRLQTIGVASVNNVVDVTNYVMMECGQPLHAFDFARLRGREIQVREARKGEPFMAIDHKTYPLETVMCVIADAQMPIALAGVMGGAYSEVSDVTTELLIESADFAPLSIRNTARKLNLHSPSSYRFERGVDPGGLDWASRRCCQLILELAGGELAAGCVAAGEEKKQATRITLRLSQLRRILGIDVPVDVVRRILTALGNAEQSASNEAIEVVPPSWRRDLTREIDLVEEVARIHGYDKIPEDVAVPMCPSHRRREERVLSQARVALVASGFDEAFTASVVPAAWCSQFSPWSSAEPLVSSTPMLKGADRLRTSLIPSLLEARRGNEAVSNPIIELFEVARIYLSRAGQLPVEQWTLGITSGSDFAAVKGVIECLLDAVHCHEPLDVVPVQLPLLNAERSCELRFAGRQEKLGFLGEVTAAGQKQFGLRSGTTIAELNLDLVAERARLIPQYVEPCPYPAISRDMNLIVDEAIRWSSLAATVRAAGGAALENLAYRETYRDAKKDGAGKKRVLLSCTFRAPDRTFTSEEADQIRDQIVAACGRQQDATLLA